MEKQKKNSGKNTGLTRICKSGSNNKTGKNHGITLVALVVSIVVMLVLAGVSINAVVGDNGIITQAQSATYATSRAVLEEWLNQLYVENYEDFSEYDNKIEALTTSSKYSSYFYNPKTDGGVGALSYVVDSEGHALYLIKKSALPDDIKSQIAGGDAGDGSYSNYVSLIDVYGVTSDLKVYYCSNGTDTILGITKEELDEDNPLRTVFASGSAMANLLSTYDTDGDGDISAEEVRSVTSLTLTSSSGVSSLAELYNLTSLKELTLDGVTLSSLDGIQNVTSLTYLCFTNYGTTGSIGDYSQMNKLTKLKYLYLVASNDSQVSSVFTAMQNTDYTSLQYLGVYDGVANVTTVDSLANLSSATKQAVNYLYLYNNKLTDISCVQNYVNVTILYCYKNSITTLTPACSNMSGLATLYAYSNQLGANESTTEKDSSTDALACLVGKSSLTNLQINSNQIVWTGYLGGFTSFSYLYLAGNANLDTTDLASIKSIYWASTNRSIDSKYTLVMNTDDVISFASLGISDDDIEDLRGNTTCIKLDLSGNSDLTNTTLQGVLSTMTSIQYLNLNDVTNLSSIAFVENMSELRELRISKTQVSDLSYLESSCSKICTLQLNPYSDSIEISLSNITNTINNMYTNIFTNNYRNASYAFGVGYGLLIGSDDLWSSLSSCSNLSSLVCYYGGLDFSCTVNLTNTSLRLLFLYHTAGMKWVLPASLDALRCWYVGDAGFYADGSRCANITGFNESGFAMSGSTAFTTTMKSLSTFPNLTSVTLGSSFSDTVLGDVSGVTFSNLTSLSIGTGSWDASRRGVSDVSGITALSDCLTSLTINYTSSSCSGWDSLSALTKLTSLNIGNTNFSDLSIIENMTSLSSLTVTDSKIMSCIPLIGHTSLTYINLTNNMLYPTSSTKDSEGNTVTYNNCEILADLNPSADNGGKLTTLYLSGNEYLSDTDYAYVQKYTWSGGCDF